MSFLKEWRKSMALGMKYCDRYGRRQEYITQTLAAALLGYTRPAYCRKETGKRPITDTDKMACLYMVERVRQGLEPKPKFRL